MVINSALECRKLCPEIEFLLVEFFEILERKETSQHFHPHPFTPEEAKKICRYGGKDLYFVALDRKRVLGYGMLRGWDEGYDVPSLGIVLHPDIRGIGLGKIFMHFLHVAAKLRAVKRIRLQVYPGNTIAVNLYKSLGYRYEGEKDGQLVGYID